MIASRSLLYLAVVCAVTAAGADVNLLKEIYGSQDLTAIAGNGRLTIGVDSAGRVALCRWPSPGLQNHLADKGSTTGPPGQTVNPGHGLQWGIEIDGELLWLSDNRWDVTQRYGPLSPSELRTTARLSGSPVVLTQTIAVHPSRDLLILRLVATGLDTPPKIFWFANFSPVTRQPLPELPIADQLAGWLNDFAAFSENGGRAVYHFRPRDPGRRDWQLARLFASRGASSERWRSFDKGTWISYASPQPTVAAHIGAERLTADIAIQDYLGNPPRDTAAVGECYSMIELSPAHQNNRFVTTLYVAFGDSAQASRALRQEALESGFERLTQYTITQSIQWLETGRQRVQLGPQSSRLFDQALRTLATCIDADSGAIVRSPSAQPPLARDWPRHGAWMTFALDLAGYTDAAERHTLFYLGAVRTTSQRGEPAGSIPHALYPNGTPAAPSLFLDTQAVAWTLWSIHNHSTFINGARRLAYLRKVWEPVALATEFLAGWSDARRGMPLHSFDPDTLRDTQSDDLLVATRHGLVSALAIAEALGKKSPAYWTRRLNELDALLKNRLMDPNLTWRLDDPLPFSLIGILDPSDPRLVREVDRRITALPQLVGYEAAKTLSEVAMQLQHDPSKRKTLKALVAPTLSKALNAPATPDALTAAHAAIATLLIHQ